MTRAVIFATTMALLLGGCGRDDEPTAISTTGACCDTSGICGVTTEANCAGSWTRAGICEPNPCPLPPPTGMVFKAAGSFTMGSPAGEVQRSGFETQHAVTLTRPFSTSQHEVTQSEWQPELGPSTWVFGSP